MNKNKKEEEKQHALSATENQFDLNSAKLIIDSIENELERLKRLLFNQSYQSLAKSHQSEQTGSDSKIIQGVFNGEEMIDDENKKYTVPQNYASKSKLIPGDALKLTISADGSFIYKQIQPIERRKAIGEIVEKNGKYQVIAEGKKYNVLLASVTYFKAQPSDKVTIIIPKKGESAWAAIENIIVDDK